MRFTTTHFRDSADCSPRWIFAKPREGADVSGESSELLKRLNSPRSFTVADIRKLEQYQRTEGELTAEHKARLNSLAEFHLSLVSQDFDADAPARTLFELRYSGLWKNIRKPIADRVEVMLSNQRKKLQPLFDRDISSFSNQDMERYLRYYQSFHLKARRAKLTPHDKEFAETVAKKFVDHAHKLMAGYKIVDGKIVPADKNTEIDYLQALRTKDKLFILQTYRMFSDQYDWAPRHDGSTGTAENLKAFSKCVVTDMIENLDDDVRRIEYLPLWEVIEDLTENESLSFVSLTVDQQGKLKEFTKRARSMHLVNWVKNWQKSGNSLLLPEHIQALKDIKEEPKQEFFGADEGEVQKVIEEFSRDNGKLYIEQTMPDGKAKFIDVIEAIETEKEKTNYKKSFKAFEKTRDALLNHSDFLAVKSGINASGEGASSYGESQLKALENFLKDPNLFDEGEEETAAKAGKDSPWKAKLEDYLENFLDDKSKGLKTIMASDDFKSSKPIKDFYNLIENFRKNPCGEDFMRQELDARAKIRELQNKAAQHEAQVSQYIALAKTFSQLNESADKSLDDYNAGLRGRIASRRLAAADLAVLFDDDEKTQAGLDLGNEVDVKNFTEKLRTFREAFGQIVSELVSDVETGIEDVGGLGVTDEDRLRLWFEVLDKALGQKNVREKIQKNAPLKEAYQNILQDREGQLPLSSNLLIESALTHYREQIYDGIMKPVNPSERVDGVLAGDTERPTEKFLSDYLSRYDRMHQDLYQAEEKQSRVQTGQREYLRHKQENESLQDKVRQGLYQRIGKVDREIFMDQLQQYTIPGADVLAVLGALQESRDIYSELMETPVDSPEFKRTRFYQILSSVIQEGLAEKYIPEIGHWYILWQAKNHNEAILDDIGGRLMKGTNQAPGLEVLNSIRLRAVEFEGDFDIIHSQFNHDFSHWNSRIAGGESIEHTELSTLFIRINSELIPKINSVTQNLEAVLVDEFPDYEMTFIRSYVQQIKEAVKRLELQLKTLDKVYQGATWTRDSETDLKRLKDAFLEIKSAFSLENGTLSSYNKNIQEGFEKIPETVTYLKDELGLFEPGGKKKAEEKFKKLHKEYEPTFEVYKERNEKVVEYLQKDIRSLSAEDFKERHSKTKQEATLMIEEIEKSVETYDRGWQRFSEPNYFEDNFYAKYQDPKLQAEALLDFQTWPILEKQIKSLNKINDGNGKWIKAYEGKKFWGLPVLHPANWPKFSIKYTFSLLDLFYRMPKKLFEAFDRREERRRERAVAEIGTAIFGDSAMGKEFQRMRWEEEDKRVKEFETRYDQENFDVWETALYRINHPNQKDEARALINLLVKEGYMRWDKPALWRTLENLQRPKKITWNIPQDLQNKSLDEIMEMVGEACSHIWTTKIFTDWDGQLEGNHKKQMESNYKNFDRMCNRAGALDEYFSDAMEKWKNGDTSVNPAEFEGFLHRAFELAKYNGQGGDKRWFYLIMGMTLKNHRGETLLSHESKDRFNKIHLKTMPFFDFFVDNACSKLDGMPVPDGTPGAHKGSWTHDDIECWGKFMMQETGNSFSDPAKNYAASEKFVFQYVLNSPVARLRADRMGRAAGQSQDHDDAHIHGAGASYQNILQMLNRSSQGSDTISPDFAAQLTQAYEPFMRHNAEYLKTQEALLGGTPGWEELRKEKLTEIGLMIRKMFLVTNTLAGNYHGHSAQSPQTLDQKYWNNDPTMTGIQENRQTINTGVRTLLDIAGESISDRTYEFTGVLEVGDNYNERKGNPDYQAVSAEVARVLNDESLFSNVDNIQKWLDRMYP